jgi:hypothetical protein
MRTKPRSLLVGLAALCLTGVAVAGDELRRLRDVAEAAKSRPDDVAVQRSAADLLAWYDTRVDQPALGDDLRADVARMRKSLASRDAFVPAYRSALSKYAAKDDSPPPRPALPERPAVATYVLADPPRVPAYNPAGWSWPIYLHEWAPPRPYRIVVKEPRRRPPARARGRR